LLSNLVRRSLLVIAATAALAACGTQPPLSAALDGGGAQPPPGGSDPVVPPPGGGGGACESVADTCEASVVGVTWGCKTRFMYGTNWAWRTFGADFGGVTAWGTPGISGDPGSFSEQLRQMKAMGVDVIRMWMFPRFTTDAIQWSSSGAPAGIGGSIVADIHKVLELAEQHDVYLMLTPFSFDNFYPTQTQWGVFSRSIKPMLDDPGRRSELLQNLLKPVAQAVQSSPYARRMIAWDIINEPEWAVSGTSGLPGDAAFTPSGGLDTVTFDVMETFLKEATEVLHANSSALVSVGGAGIKWPKAWSRVGLDFYQFHYYDWLYEHFPYETVTLASVGVTDKPVVMGEFPGKGLSAISYKGLPPRSASQFSQDMLTQGYAGTLSWSFTDPAFPLNPTETKAFADARGCEVTF
jgi:hypothetical protein